MISKQIRLRDIESLVLVLIENYFIMLLVLDNNDLSLEKVVIYINFMFLIFKYN